MESRTAQGAVLRRPNEGQPRRFPMSVPQISALARIAEETRPDDPQMQAALLLRVRELHRLMSEARARDLAACLDAAAELVEILAEDREPSRADIHRAVLGVLHAVEREFLCERPEPYRELEDTGAPPAYRELASRAAAPGATPMLDDMLLGRILRELGHLDEEALHKALEFQRLGGGRLGDILVRTGAVLREEVEAAARIQTELRKQAPASALPAKNTTEAPPGLRIAELSEEERPGGKSLKRKTNGYLIGQILVQMGAVAASALEDALIEARASGRRLGEVLVERKLVDWDTVDRAERAQKQLRRLAGLDAPGEPQGASSPV